MRTNYSYNQQRYQPYERRQDNRNHPFPRHRYNSAQTQDRPPRPMMSDNSRHRVFPSNQGHFSSPRQTSGSEGRSMDGNGRRSESAHLVGSAGPGSTSSSSSALHNPGSKSDSAENLNDRIHPHRDHSFRQSPSSITNQPLSSCISTTLSQPSAQQHGEVDSIQSSSHPEPSAETLPGTDGNLPANRKCLSFYALSLSLTVIKSSAGKAAVNKGKWPSTMTSHRREILLLSRSTPNTSMIL